MKSTAALILMLGFSAQAFALPQLECTGTNRDNLSKIQVTASVVSSERLQNIVTRVTSADDQNVWTITTTAANASRASGGMNVFKEGDDNRAGGKEGTFLYVRADMSQRVGSKFLGFDETRDRSGASTQRTPLACTIHRR